MLIVVILSAEINATDIFQEVFAPDPRSRQAWARFRQLVLEPGGSKSDLDIIKSILGGRLPNTQALSALVGKP
jgi:Zn-dependent oligopeptidase